MPPSDSPYGEYGSPVPNIYQKPEPKPDPGQKRIKKKPYEWLQKERELGRLIPTITEYELVKGLTFEEDQAQEEAAQYLDRRDQFAETPEELAESVGEHFIDVDNENLGKAREETGLPVDDMVIAWLLAIDDIGFHIGSPADVLMIAAKMVDRSTFNKLNWLSEEEMAEVFGYLRSDKSAAKKIVAQSATEQQKVLLMAMQGAGLPTDPAHPDTRALLKMLVNGHVTESADAAEGILALSPEEGQELYAEATVGFDQEFDPAVEHDPSKYARVLRLVSFQGFKSEDGKEDEGLQYYLEEYMVPTSEIGDVPKEDWIWDPKKKVFGGNGHNPPTAEDIERMNLGKKQKSKVRPNVFLQPSKAPKAPEPDDDDDVPSIADLQRELEELENESDTGAISMSDVSEGASPAVEPPSEVKMPDAPEEDPRAELIAQVPPIPKESDGSPRSKGKVRQEFANDFDNMAGSLPEGAKPAEYKRGIPVRVYGEDLSQDRVIYDKATGAPVRIESEHLVRGGDFVIDATAHANGDINEKTGDSWRIQDCPEAMVVGFVDGSKTQLGVRVMPSGEYQEWDTEKQIVRKSKAESKRQSF